MEQHHAASVAHTPWPWLAFENAETAGEEWDVVGPESVHVAAISGHAEVEETSANARLVAAAPDLLEACYAALELRCPDGDDDECGTLVVINEAIEKATKEPN